MTGIVAVGFADEAPSHQFITKPDVLVSNLSFSHIREIMVLELFYQERDNEKI